MSPRKPDHEHDYLPVIETATNALLMVQCPACGAVWQTYRLPEASDAGGPDGDSQRARSLTSAGRTLAAGVETRLVESPSAAESFTEVLAQQRWEADRYAYLTGNDDSALWQLERENAELRARKLCHGYSCAHRCEECGA